MANGYDCELECIHHNLCSDGDDDGASRGVKCAVVAVGGGGGGDEVDEMTVMAFVV